MFGNWFNCIKYMKKIHEARKTYKLDGISNHELIEALEKEMEILMKIFFNYYLNKLIIHNFIFIKKQIISDFSLKIIILK